MAVKSIDSDWLKRYVDQLLEAAHGLPIGKFRDAVASRAEAILDMAKAWKESEDKFPDEAELLEAAYWRFDTLRTKGSHGDNPQPERDAFKMAVSGLLNKMGAPKP